MNEPPPHTTPYFKNAIGGDGESGVDWIVNSFKWAREFCPGATLILNDYNIIEYQSEHDRFVAMLSAALEAGAPIDAVGAEAHDVYKKDTGTVKGFLDRFAAMGLPVYITELDINIADDDEQRRVMEEQFDALQPQRRQRHHLVRLHRRLHLAGQHGPHAPGRHDAAGHGLADGLPRSRPVIPPAW